MSVNVDARGLACPQPVIATKKALDSIENGVVTTIVDNQVAKENVIKFATANNCGVHVEEQNGHYYIKITKGNQPPAVQLPTQPQAAGDTVFLLTQETLGHGSNELGAVLMKSFFFTLVEKDPAPRAVMLINSAVKLAAVGSPVLEHMQKLSAKGVAILACGTCLDYYGLKDKLAVGSVTNMYTIVEELSANQAVTL